MTLGTRALLALGVAALALVAFSVWWIPRRLVETGHARLEACGALAPIEIGDPGDVAALSGALGELQAWMRAHPRLADREHEVDAETEREIAEFVAGVLARPEVARALAAGARADLGSIGPFFSTLLRTRDRLVTAASKEASRGRADEAASLLGLALELERLVPASNAAIHLSFYHGTGAVLREVRELVRRGIGWSHLRRELEPGLEALSRRAHTEMDLRAEVVEMAPLLRLMGNRFLDPLESWRIAAALHEAADRWPQVVGPPEAVLSQREPDERSPYLQLQVSIDRRELVHAARALARDPLAAGAFREERGRFPADLDELGPLFSEGVPLDPHAAAPFRYEVRDGRALLGPARWADADPRGPMRDLLSWEVGE